jgi:diguanylate cyclase (GGDEF)-like protein/PAS domain S-box-containing protein
LLNLTDNAAAALSSRGIFPVMDIQRSAPLEAVMDLLLDAVCVVDREGHFLFVSAAFERIFGYRCDEVAGRAMIEYVLPEDRERTLRAAAEIMSGEPKLSFENRYVRKDGRVVHVMWSARWSENEQVRVAVAHDITARKRAESMQTAMYAMSEAAHVATDPFELLALAHRIVADLLPADRAMVAVRNDNDGALNIAYAADAQGLPADALPARCLEFCEDIVRRGEPEMRALDDGEQWLGAPLSSADDRLGAIALKRRAGGPLFAVRDRDLLHFVATQIATALERMRLQTRLRRMAQYDALTGLPNRALLHDRIDTAIAAARRARGRLALLYLDLNRFKDVNDTLGHAAGDQLLQDIAQRLRRAVRDADTVARLGGDEFVVLLGDLTQAADAAHVADKIGEALRPPFVVEGRELDVSASIGVAHWPEDGDGTKELLLTADAAMYAAKRRR